jgi:DNA-binding MarR family transcriptional regulator
VSDARAAAGPHTTALAARRRAGREAHETNTVSERGQQALLAGSALAVFRLNGQFLAVTDRLARPAGLTAAWWQVLGAVLREPLPVAGIARAMGITRQSVQRVADLLVERGLAAYEPNPAHRRAKLLAPTPAGLATVRRIDPGHREFAARLCEALGGEGEFAETLGVLSRLSEALDRLEADEPGP